MHSFVRQLTATVPRIPGRSIASALVGIAVCAALTLTTGSAARAGCVHGLGVSSRLDREDDHSHDGARHFELLTKAGALVERGDGSSVPFADGSSLPCSGPFCSNSNRLPFPIAPTTAEPPRPPLWAGLIGVPESPPISSIPLPSRVDTPRPTHLAPAVFHPPRLFSLSVAIVAA